MTSELFAKWCQNHKDHIYSNGQGAIVILNFPAEFEAEVFSLPSSVNMFDLTENGVCTPATNLPIRLNSRGKLTQIDKANIRAALNRQETTVQLADTYRVSRATISRIKNGR